MKNILSSIILTITLSSCGLSKIPTMSNPSPNLNVNRILFTYLPTKETGYSVTGFFNACDSILNGHKIKDSVFVLTLEELQTRDFKRLEKATKKFVPDCIIFLIPTDANEGLKGQLTNKYRAFMVQIDYAQMMGFDNSFSMPTPINIGSFKLLTTHRKAEDLVNGQKAATPLVNSLCSCGFPKPSRLMLLDSVEFEKIESKQNPSVISCKKAKILRGSFNEFKQYKLFVIFQTNHYSNTPLVNSLCS